MREDESGGGTGHGKESVREGRGEEDKRGQRKGGERKRNGEKWKEEREAPPLVNSQFNHCTLVRITSQRREQ